MRVVVFGLGRAGRAHVRRLRGLGVECVTVDPDPVRGADFVSFEAWQAAQANVCEYGVIATPPDTHLDLVEKLTGLGLRVLCEKPLCGFGQLTRTLTWTQPNVMVYYNYAWHPVVRRLRDRAGASMVYMDCAQQRVVPEWGLLLDHGSHDLFILDYAFGLHGLIRAESTPEQLTVLGYLERNCVFCLWERIRPGPRLARVLVDGQVWFIEPDEEMHYAALQAFLAGPPYEIDLQVGRRVQSWLETIQALANEVRH